MKRSILNSHADGSLFRDSAFAASFKAQNDPAQTTINATLGSLRNEDGRLLTLKTVYDSFERIPADRKASYAGRVEGNVAYNKAVFDWLNRANNLNMPHEVVATAGGTGAISLTLQNCLDHNETFLIPCIGWGSYRTMASQFEFKTRSYKLTADSIIAAAEQLMNDQGKVLIIINDPCHNPTGLSFRQADWQRIMNSFRRLAGKGPVILINDIAYLDYSHDPDHATEYFSLFNNLPENMAVILTFSCSKTMTAYGMRLGAAVILTGSQESAELLYNAFIRTARSTWSNVNNGFMDCFADVVNNHIEEFKHEKQAAIELLKKRSSIFLAEAGECGLPLYEYHEGFFATIRIEDPAILDNYYRLLEENHIYTVRFATGIRIGLCSLSIAQVTGLAARLYSLYQQARKEANHE